MQNKVMPLQPCVLWNMQVVEAQLQPDVANQYVSMEGGYALNIADAAEQRAASVASTIGIVTDDARQHRRPQYPPADKRLLFSAKETVALQRIPFRPLILTHNSPRFLFDGYTAGGLLGHFYIGVLTAHRANGVTTGRRFTCGT